MAEKRKIEVDPAFLSFRFAYDDDDGDGGEDEDEQMCHALADWREAEENERKDLFSSSSVGAPDLKSVEGHHGDDSSKRHSGDDDDESGFEWKSSQGVANIDFFAVVDRPSVTVASNEQKRAPANSSSQTSGERDGDDDDYDEQQVIMSLGDQFEDLGLLSQVSSPPASIFSSQSVPGYQSQSHGQPQVPHPVQVAAGEYGRLVKRVSELYTTLRHCTPALMHLHSLGESDPALMQGEIKSRTEMECLSLSHVRKHLAYAFQPTVTEAPDADSVFGSDSVTYEFFPCVRGDQCVGRKDEWAQLYYANAKDPPFVGAVLPALIYPRELELLSKTSSSSSSTNTSAIASSSSSSSPTTGPVATVVSRAQISEVRDRVKRRPCFFCTLKETHETWAVFAVNRFEVYSHIAPFQAFYNTHGPGEFNKSVLLQPSGSVFNGLVLPVAMYLHPYLVWDYDVKQRRWFVNLEQYAHPKQLPEGINPGTMLVSPRISVPKTNSPAATVAAIVSGSSKVLSSSKKPLN